MTGEWVYEITPDEAVKVVSDRESHRIPDFLAIGFFETGLNPLILASNIARL